MSRVVFGALLLLSTGWAEANEWQRSFDVKRIDAHLRHDGWRLLVARAGASHRELDRCAEALLSALRTSARVKLVMNDKPLGRVIGLDDRQLVRLAAGIPVDGVVTVRVFAQPEGPPTAVVALYDKEGQALAGFAVVRGKPVPEPTSRPSRGVSAKTTAAVKTSIQQADEGSEKRVALAEYKKKRVRFNREWGPTIFTTEWKVPGWVGESGHPLEGDHFYDYVGRADLAASYRRWKWIKYSLVVTCGVITLGSIVGAIMISNSAPSALEDEAKHKGWTNAAMALGISGGLGGPLIGLAIIAFMDPHPVREMERLGLTRRYNHKLQRDLGLEDRDLVSSQRSPGARVVFQGVGLSRRGVRLTWAF
jgi:hypothetical protein